MTVSTLLRQYASNEPVAGELPSRTTVVNNLGVQGDGVGVSTPFELRDHLLQAPVRRRGMRSVDLSVGGATFHVLVDLDDVSWHDIALNGHRLMADRAPELLDDIEASLRLLSTRPPAWQLVQRFIVTLVPVQADETLFEAPRLLTSCSLPEYPLAVFLSPLARRHIPPLSLAKQPSVRLLAENLFHESVHQVVNYEILTGGLLPEEYDSSTSPKIPIFWRQEDAGRNKAWELDRVLHAAAVYSQLLWWRESELRSGELTHEEQITILEATVAGLQSAEYLVNALTDHVDLLSPRGALFVGRLHGVVQESRVHLMPLLDSVASGALTKA